MRGRRSVWNLLSGMCELVLIGHTHHLCRARAARRAAALRRAGSHDLRTTLYSRAPPLSSGLFPGQTRFLANAADMR